MIVQWGCTTQRVVRLSRLGESSDFFDSLSRATRTLPRPPIHLRAVARPNSEKTKGIRADRMCRHVSVVERFEGIRNKIECIAHKKKRFSHLPAA